MSYNRFILPYTQTMEQSGVPNEAAYLIFYQTDMVTQQTTYSDYLCMIPSPTVSIMYNSTLVNAIQANSAGVFPTIYMPSANIYYWVLLDENFNTLKTENQYSVPPVSTLNANQFVNFMGNTYVGIQAIEIVGTTYAISTTTSWGNLITFDNPNPVAVSIAAPSSTTFPAGWFALFQNNGIGMVTITGGTNINGSPTLILQQGGSAIIESDGTIFNATTSVAAISAANTLKGNNTNASASTTDLTVSQILTMLGFSGDIVLTRGTAQAASGSSVTFASLPAGIKRITVMFNGVTASQNMEVQLSQAATFATTGYVSGYSASSGVGTVAANSTIGFIVGNGTTLNGSLILTNITGNQWVGSFAGAEFPGGAAGNPAGGQVTLSGTLDGVRIVVDSAGTFSAGTLNIMYE